MGKRRIALSLAWAKTVNDLTGSYSRAAVSSLVAVLISGGSYLVLSRLGRDAPIDALLPIVMGPAVLFSVGLVGLIVNWICRVPYQQWGNVEGRVAALEQMLSPKFSIVPLLGQRAVGLEYGHVALSPYTGTKQITITQSNKLLRLDVFNETAKTLENCEGYLARLEEEGVGEPVAWQSIPLPWLPVGEAAAAVDIPSHGQRSLALFRVIGDRVQLLTNTVPLPMVRAIKDKGHYHGMVVLTAKNCAATYVAFELVCDAPDNEPYLNVARRGIGEDDQQSWAREKLIGP